MHFGDNFSRLIGMFGLTSREAAELLGVSPQTISTWLNRPSTRPATEAGLRITELFEVPLHRLINEPFSELLDLLGDKERYERVEAKTRRQSIKAVS